MTRRQRRGREVAALREQVDGLQRRVDALLEGIAAVSQAADVPAMLPPQDPPRRRLRAVK